ncbi:MAG: terminase large subunit [Candidatus Humimicrobiaceae bacterium]
MYDKEKAEKAVGFIQTLKHTKGKWYGHKFELLPWEKDIVQKIFGTIKKDGYRQYNTAYVEVAKKNGKSELAAAIALKCLFADSEMGGEVYSAAVDRTQASIVFNVAAAMVRQSPALMKRCKIIDSQKRIVVYKTNSFYQVLSADVPNKHGLNPSCVIFDELHAQKTRDLWDVLTSGAGDARTQPLTFVITTAGYDRNSICWEQHNYALEVKNGIKRNDSFLPVLYYVDEKDNWEDEKNWYKANPSLGITIGLDRVRQAFKKAKELPSEENNFRRLRLNQWVTNQTRWIPDDKWLACYQIKDGVYRFVDYKNLLNHKCYGGLDLSSNIDITAFVLVFPEFDGYYVLPYFFIPEDTMRERSRRDGVDYLLWVKEGYIFATPGNVIDYAFIESKINEICSQFKVEEIAYDRWNADMLVQKLTDEGMTMVPIGMGTASLSTPTKRLETFVLGKKLIHGGNPVLRWMANNVTVKSDAAGNVKPDKSKSSEKIDGIVALIMAIDRTIRHEETQSVYETRGVSAI